VHSLLSLLGGGAGEAVMLPAAACLRYLALAPGAADVMAGRGLLAVCPESVTLLPTVEDCLSAGGMQTSLIPGRASSRRLRLCHLHPTVLDRSTRVCLCCR
jgi:hypothetical protein